MLQLTVTPAGAATEQLNFQSADFFSFLREHPQETARYVRPLLRDLGQEAVFAPEPTIAWQVFGELWKADPMLERRVRELLPLLDVADFHVRDAAQRRLRQLGRDGAAVLMHMDRAKLSPEQNARIDRFLVPYAHLGANEMVRLRSDVGFLLDCLYSDDLPLRRAALERLRAVARPDLQFDVDAGPSARGAAVAVLRRQLLPSARRPANELHSAVR